MALALRYAVRSHRGLVRGNNEDSVYAGPRLLAIADGMGGHAAGEVASKIVIGAMEQLDEDRPLGDLLAALRETALQGNQGIAETAAGNSALEGMGTTLTALRFVGAQVGLVHVGDSRAYLLRGDELSQITHDDTYVQSLVDTGRLTAEEASTHPRKSVILRALTGIDVDPDVSIREARVGDRYLLCTDGLSDVVTARTLAEAMADGEPQDCADRLVDLALRGGGPDNVTCIVADVIETSGGQEGDEVPVIGGAFLDAEGSNQPAPTQASPETDSPAERAARITQPPVAAMSPQVVKRRPRWRTPVILLVTVLLIAGALAGFYAYTQTRYFVGKDGDEVAIFRGVNAEFGPLKFFNVKRNTNVRLANLQRAARTQVENGITADGEADAARIVAALNDQLLPLCSAPPPTTAPPRPTPSSATSATAGSSVPPGTGSTSAVPFPTFSTPAPEPTAASTPVPTFTSPSATPSSGGDECRTS